MKVSQLRRVLTVMADLYQTSGRVEDADALRKLAEVLKPADKEHVGKLVEKLAG
jgi:hypothetical protein